jgi:hypothetical protein
MYITNTTENVKKLFYELEEKDNITKLRFLIYIFGQLNNKQINSKKEENPDLYDNDENLVIFKMQDLGFDDNYCEVLLQYFIMIHNAINPNNEIIEDNGNVIGVKYSNEELSFNSMFDRLSFKEQLDVFSEIFIRYDNETYFTEKIIMFSFKNDVSGFDMANMTQKIKKELD